jgi:hypothetical protein
MLIGYARVYPGLAQRVYFDGFNGVSFTWFPTSYSVGTALPIDILTAVCDFSIRHDTAQDRTANA